MKKRSHSETSNNKSNVIAGEFVQLKELQDEESDFEPEEIDDSDDSDDCAVEGGSDEEIIIEDEIEETDEVESNEEIKVEASTSGCVSRETEVDEYENDSSDEEDARNTIGNIPIEWYKEKGHIGYDLEGKRIMKDGKEADELDELIMKMEDENYWRQVVDPQTNKKVVLSDEEIKLIKKYLKGRYMGKPANNTTDDFSEPFVREVMTHPVTNQPENKRSFVPSKWERLKVGQIIHSIKMGWMKLTEKKDSDDEDEMEKQKGPKFYDIWGQDDEPQGPRRVHQYIAPPKVSLPGHYESYNPPPEYLFTPEEEQQWRDKEPSERRLNFIPKKYNNLRTVPGYGRFVNEKMERCLDLYMCPRQIKMRAKVAMEDLLPKLPSPRDLLPFPTIQALLFRGHTDIVRSVSFDPSGQFLASGSDDCTVRFWEVKTGRCLRVFEMEAPVKVVKWNPKKSVLVAAVERKVFVIGCNITESEEDPFEDLDVTEKVEEKETIPVKWEVADSDGKAGVRMIISHPQTVTHLSWQKGGDYFSAVLSDGKSLSVLIHRLSSRTTMKPIEKMKGYPQCVLFHPSKPLLFVATKQSVRSYNLATAKGSKKMFPNCNWISSMSIHPKGENLIVGSYDNRITWFDTQQSTKPYKVLKYHKSAVRQVVFHNTLPLFASCSDDGVTQITHSSVYNDLLTQPLIVPVKRLSGHIKTNNLCVLDCQFHPRDPIVVTAGADKTIRLYI